MITRPHPEDATGIAPVYGLVLAGGDSLRMGSDKADISYRGVPQVVRTHELLVECCEKAFVSVREEQRENAVFSGLPQIHDRFIGFGPMGGVLSAMTAHPGAAWLVLACDLPFLSSEALRYLLKHRKSENIATAYLSPEGFPEPLFTLYEARSVHILHASMARGEHSLQKVLVNSDVGLVTPPSPEILRNANTPLERDAAQAALGRSPEDAS